jgi:acyl-coenzyme A thioesterase PaaI-like protein
VAERLAHDELCFGCGHANLFGLQLELERVDGGVSGRFFVKQDHQGPPGLTHPGLLTAALEEAMALALEAEGIVALPESFEVRAEAPAPIGFFVQLSGWLESREGERLVVAAEAALAGAEPRLLARGRGTFSPTPDHC